MQKLYAHTHTPSLLSVHVCALGVYVVCVRGVCSCISECEIRLNSGRGAVDGGRGGELQVLGYARFTPRYVGVSVCV